MLFSPVKMYVLTNWEQTQEGYDTNGKWAEKDLNSQW